MIGFIKRLLLKYYKLSIVTAYLYTYLFGYNKISGKKFNKISLKNSYIKKSKILIDGRNNIVIVGQQSRLDKCKIYINGNNNRVILGDRVAAVECEIHIEDNNNLVSIGNRTHISGKTHLACIEGTNILIGQDCLFSSDITFRTGDSHSILNLIGKRINPSKDIIVGDRVWIGNKTILTKGAKIVEDSIVATGAIVTSQFESPNVIVGGIPAKVLKTKIKWDERRITIGD